MTDQLPQISPRVWNELAEYLAGKGSPDERAAMELRISQEPDLALAFERVRQVWGAEALPVQPVDTDMAWTAFRARASGQVANPAPSVSSSRSQVKSGGGSIRHVMPWLAGAAGAVAVGIALIGINPSTQTERQYATVTGERTTIELADGSRVTLAPQTVLTVSSEFGRSTRSVRLSGQAFFQVKDAAAVPFVVHTGEVATTVLGTAFDVKRYEEDALTRVVVTQGKVQARLPNKQTLVLTAGMLGEMSDDAIRDSARVDAQGYAAWTEGRLDFRAVPVAELLATVERWSGVRFQVKDSAILRDAVSGSLNIQETSMALKYLRSLLDVQMTFETRGDTTVVILSSNEARVVPPPARRENQPFSKPSSGVGL